MLMKKTVKCSLLVLLVFVFLQALVGVNVNAQTGDLAGEKKSDYDRSFRL